MQTLNSTKNINIYESENNSLEWVINMIITDNEASAVQSALSQAGVDVKITRLTHWEIIGANNSSLNEIEKTGELFNSNKEYIYDYKTEKNERFKSNSDSIFSNPLFIAIIIVIILSIFVYPNL